MGVCYSIQAADIPLASESLLCQIDGEQPCFKMELVFTRRILYLTWFILTSRSITPLFFLPEITLALWLGWCHNDLKWVRVG